MKIKQNKKISLIVALLITVFMNAQDFCVKRVNRYSEAPSIVTIYRCISLPLTKDSCNVEYTISILVDSIYRSEKYYRLTCSFNQPVVGPFFEIQLVTEGRFFIPTTYVSEDGLSLEADLDQVTIDSFKLDKIVGITVWHADLDRTHNLKTPCNSYFKEFINKY